MSDFNPYTDLPQVSFSELLDENATLFYSLLGGIPQREWLERRELLQAGVLARQIKMLYPRAKLHVSARLAGISRWDVEILGTIVAATSSARTGKLKSATLRHKDRSALPPWHWDVPASSDLLLEWVRGGRAEDTSLYAPKIVQAQRVLGQLMWAFENPQAFSWTEQLAIIESLDGFFDRLSTHSAVRTPAYHESRTLRLYHSGLLVEVAQPNQTERLFPVQSRGERLVELWDQAYASGVI